MLGFDALGRLALGQAPSATAGATVFEGSWHQSFPDGTRRRKPMPTGAHQFAAFVKASPFGETWNPDRGFFFPLSEPVRPRRPLLTGLPPSSQQFASFVQFSPFREDIKINEWFMPFSEPVRFRPRLVTANQWFGRGIEFPLTSSVALVSVTFIGIATLGGVPTSNYKKILATDNTRKIIYTAEISPWTLTS